MQCYSGISTIKCKMLHTRFTGSRQAFFLARDGNAGQSRDNNSRINTTLSSVDKAGLEPQNVQAQKTNNRFETYGTAPVGFYFFLPSFTHTQV